MELLNVTKVHSHVMLIMHNLRIILSNVGKKKKSTTECGKNTVKSDISTTQYDNGTIKCEKKNKGIIECDKSTVTCNIGNTQCDNGTIKCEEKIEVPSNVRNVRSNVMLNCTM